MNSDSSLRVLALFVFAISGVAAFCLGALSYTFVTGELPFNLQPMLAMPAEPEAPLAELEERKPLEQHNLRPQEEYAVLVFREIERERQRLAERDQQLRDREKALNVLADNVRHLQKQLQETETRVRRLLVTIDKHEIDNLKGLAQMISNLNQQQAAEMLLEMDDNRIARIIYYMDNKNAANVISVLMQGAANQRQRAAGIIEKIQRLTE